MQIWRRRWRIRRTAITPARPRPRSFSSQVYNLRITKRLPIAFHQLHTPLRLRQPHIQRRRPPRLAMVAQRPRDPDPLIARLFRWRRARRDPSRHPVVVWSETSRSSHCYDRSLTCNQFRQNNQRRAAWQPVPPFGIYIFASGLLCPRGDVRGVECRDCLVFVNNCLRVRGRDFESDARDELAVLSGESFLFTQLYNLKYSAGLLCGVALLSAYDGFGR